MRLFKTPPQSFGQGCSILLLALLGGCSFFNPPVFHKSDLRRVDRFLFYPTVEARYRSLAGDLPHGRGPDSQSRQPVGPGLCPLGPLPLDSGFRPEKPDPGARPFLLIFSHQIEPSRMRSGRPITVIGRVRGELQSFPKEAGRPPRHVVVDVLEEHLWGSGSGLINGGSPFPTPAPGAGIPFTPY